MQRADRRRGLGKSARSLAQRHKVALPMPRNSAAFFGRNDCDDATASPFGHLRRSHLAPHCLQSFSSTILPRNRARAPQLGGDCAGYSQSASAMSPCALRRSHALSKTVPPFWKSGSTPSSAARISAFTPGFPGGFFGRLSGSCPAFSRAARIAASCTEALGKGFAGKDCGT